MKLYTPSKREATELLGGPERFIGLSIHQDALPPGFLLERALAAEEGSWCMPRLFCEESTAHIVGSGAFKSEPKKGRIEIGYGISPACRGRGYATAGVRLMVEAAFSSGLIEEIFAETSPSNEPSRRVLAKAGFINSGSGANDAGPVDLWVKRKEPDQPPRPAAPSGAALTLV